MRVLVSDLLDMTQTRLGGSLRIEREQANLALICQEATDEMRTVHPDRTFELDLSGDLSGTWVPARLSQILANLLQNAVQHGAQGRPVTLSLHEERDRVVLSIHNEGAAISESARLRIFELLIRGEGGTASRQSSSLGLGLYIAREIARAHGGSIDVKSSENEGTCFTVCLPRR